MAARIARDACFGTERMEVLAAGLAGILAVQPDRLDRAWYLRILRVPTQA